MSNLYRSYINSTKQKNEETGPAWEWGTDEGVARYKKITPGEEPKKKTKILKFTDYIK